MNTRIGTLVGNVYPITFVIETGEFGWAVGYQTINNEKYWATWEYRTNTEDDYYWGHYMMPDEKTARKDALERANMAPDRMTIYREVEHELLLEDAQSQVEFWKYDHEDDYKEGKDEFDYERLVARFELRRSADVPENDTWTYVIDEFADDYNLLDEQV